MLRTRIREWLFSQTTFRRISAEVRDEPAFARWATTMGFRPEGLLRSWDEDGRDGIAFGWVR
jgi:hypothetical protein